LKDLKDLKDPKDLYDLPYLPDRHNLLFLFLTERKCAYAKIIIFCDSCYGADAPSSVSVYDL
jgi:hypothetical protein